MSGDSDKRERGEWSAATVPPDWRWAPFAEVFENVTSSERKLGQKSYQDSGAYPVVDQGADRIGGWTDDPGLVHPASPPLIVFGDHTRRVKLIEQPFVQGADGVKVLRPRSGAEARYCFHALRAIDLPDKGYSRHFKFLRASSFPMPPSGDEQRRIVARIESLQARSRRAKEALDAIPPLLERYRQSVLAAAFRGDLTADWRRKNPDVEPASVLLERIRAERKRRWIDAEAEKARGKAEAKAQKAGKPWAEADDRRALEAGRKRGEKRYKEPEPVDPEGLPGLPDGWCWVALEVLADVVDPHPSHRTPKVDPRGVPYLGIGDITPSGTLVPGGGRLVGTTVLEEHRARYCLRSGDFIFGKIGTIGSPKPLPEPFDYTVSANVILVQPRAPGLDARWLLEFLRSPRLEEEVAGLKAATSQPAFGIKKLRRLAVPLAPTSESREVLHVVSERAGRARMVKTAAINAARLSKTLDESVLAAAFRGEL